MMEPKKKRKGGDRLPKADPADKTQAGEVPFQPEKRPKPHRTRRQKILFGLYIALTAVAALIVAAYIFWNLFSAPPSQDELTVRPPQTTTVINEKGEEVEVEIPGLPADRKERFYTFLLVGRDIVGGGLTDTIMLGAYDVPNQKLNVLSIPRDTYVKYSGETMLINAVYNSAGGGDKGIEALKAEVGELTGVIPDFHVIVEWTAVGELAEAIGGVWFDVPWDMNYDDPGQDLHIHISAGYQHLSPADTMRVVRWRKNNDGSHSALGDIGRIQIQQSFMKAVIEQCLQPNVLLPNLAEYIRIFQENVVTNLSVPNMAYFAKSAIGSLDMDHVEFITLPYKSAGDGQHLLPVAAKIVEVVNESINPYKEDIQPDELNVVTSGPASNSGTSPSTTPPPINTPEMSDDPDVTDDPGTAGDPDVTDTPGGTDDPGATDDPPVSQEPETTPPTETAVPPQDPVA